MKNNRLFELDALRGVAALSVLLYHYTTKYDYFFHPLQPMAFQFLAGACGVGLFFMISGFVIFMTLENTKRPMDFIVSRFSRLFPAYWAAIFITFFCLHFFPLNNYIPQASKFEAAINLTMLQDWFKVTEVDGVYWTLTIELTFYFLVFTVFICRGLKYIELLGCTWLILMVLNSMFPGHAPYLIQVSQLLTYGHLFFVGILFYNIKFKGGVWHRHLLVASCVGVQYFMAREMPIVKDTVLIMLVFLIVFYLFIFGRLTLLVQKPMIFLGSISYSLYLTHQYIGYVIINHLVRWGLNPWVCLIIPTIFALSLASCITYLIEKPAMSFIRQVYKKKLFLFRS